MEALARYMTRSRFGTAHRPGTAESGGKQLKLVMLLSNLASLTLVMVYLLLFADIVHVRDDVIYEIKNAYGEGSDIIELS